MARRRPNGKKQSQGLHTCRRLRFDTDGLSTACLLDLSQSLAVKGLSEREVSLLVILKLFRGCEHHCHDQGRCHAAGSECSHHDAEFQGLSEIIGLPVGVGEGGREARPPPLGSSNALSITDGAKGCHQCKRGRGRRPLGRRSSKLARFSH